MAIPKECKRLAEVDFPIAAVSKHAAREKSIRHGHPSTLHLWWARRPLAACRAMLMALLLPDPVDPLCPEDFKGSARELLPRATGDVGPSDADLRRKLLDFIADFANWDNAAKPLYLEVGRGLVNAAHPEEPPLVVDPFAGGGSIPLEALRVGCDAFASDLNPVACLILKVLLEDIPRHGPGLADELREAGKAVKEAAGKELAEFYPADPDGAKPIAYLWARTVRCESPNCGAEIPLMRSFWLCKKPKRRRALRPEVRRDPGQPPRVEFGIFTPDREADVPRGTVTRAKATCLCCGKSLSPDRVRAQLSEQRGGADVIFGEDGQRVGGARMLAVVTLPKDAERRRTRRPPPGAEDFELPYEGRGYRLPTAKDYGAVRKARIRLAELVAAKAAGGASLVPDEPTPAGGGSGAGRAFSIQKYGMMEFGDLFTVRQKLALMTLAGAARKAEPVSGVGDLLGLTVDRVASRCSSLSLWRYHADQEKVEHVFGRQVLPIVWDFAEAVVTSKSTGSFQDGLGVVAQCVQSVAAAFDRAGQVSVDDARRSALPDEAAGVWFTDPPYYDAVPYSDLSDFFFVWLKRTLPGHPLLHDPLDPSNPLTPKAPEIVQDETREQAGRPKDRAFFENSMGATFREGRRVLSPDGVGCVVFAHKSTEGWEALLEGMVRGGWAITGSWPIATEMANRMRARDSAALATSVHLVCRPRPEDAPVGDWQEVFRELPVRVGEWMERLQAEKVRGADLVFACIGPALEVYSRFSKVVDPEDREIPLGGDPAAHEPHRRGYLAYVWETVARLALEQVLGTAEAQARNGAAGALEEDARLTALFLWTLQDTNGNGKDGEGKGKRKDAPDDEEDDADAGPRARKPGLRLIYDVVRRFAQPLGIRLVEWEGRIIETEKGVVRLLPVRERARHLLGEEGGPSAAVVPGEPGVQWVQLSLTRAGMEDPAKPTAPSIGGHSPKQVTRRGSADHGKAPSAHSAPTTLDRVHAAVLLQAMGRSSSLRALLQAEQERGPDFVRLANALVALYPPGTEEKRLLEAMLLYAG